MHFQAMSSFAEFNAFFLQEANQTISHNEPMNVQSWRSLPSILLRQATRSLDRSVGGIRENGLRSKKEERREKREERRKRKEKRKKKERKVKKERKKE